MEQTSSTDIFDILVWVGAACTLLGILGLIWCVVTVWRARGAGLPDDEMRAVMARVLPRNLAALFVSVIGLMLVILGISMG